MPWNGNPYTSKRCRTCSKPAVGVVYKKDVHAYLCSDHFNPYSRELDRRLQMIEDRQWGDQDWYREAFPRRMNWKHGQRALL